MSPLTYNSAASAGESEIMSLFRLPSEASTKQIRINLGRFHAFSLVQVLRTTKEEERKAITVC